MAFSFLCKVIDISSLLTLGIHSSTDTFKLSTRECTKHLIVGNATADMEGNAFMFSHSFSCGRIFFLKPHVQTKAFFYSAEFSFLRENNRTVSPALNKTH